MHAKQVLSRWLENRLVIGQPVRAAVLIRVVQALLLGGKAALTLLGRNRSGTAHVKHHIKVVARLLGSRLLHQELGDVYRALAHSLFVGNQRPVLSVDWSDFECGKGRQWTMIKAAAPAGGRAVAVYARVFPVQEIQ